MESSENVDICLEGFAKNIQENWKDLQSENDFYDMVLACEGKMISAHKVIVSSSSPVLKNILKHSSQNPFIYLTGVKYEDLQNIVTLIYQGEVAVAEESLDFFLDVAENLEIKGFCKRRKEFSNLQAKLPEQCITMPNEKSINEVDFENINLKSNKLLNKNIMKLFDEDSVKGSPEMKNYDQYIEAMIKNEFIDSPLEISYDYDIANFPIVKDETVQKMEIKTTISPNKEKYNSNQYHIKNFDQYSTFYINPEREYCYCTLCKKIYNDKFRFREHVRSTHQKNYTCHHCNYKSKIFSQHKSHIQAAHEGIRHACPQCDHKAMTKGSLKSHMQSMHEGVNYPCDLCDHKAKQRPGLKRHKALVHNIGKELLCEQCDFQTRHNEKLKNHVKIKHEGIKEVCDKCCKTFAERKHLQRHMDSVHNNVRFQCDQCDKSTTQKGDLIRHIRKVHV